VSPEGEPFADQLARQIEAHGPITVAHYIGLANAHYYGNRDPFGRGGDFITAPEISQMFGELIGLWLADMRIRSAPARPPAYVELGPGRGTLAADALRAMASATTAPPVHLVETSEALRVKQRITVEGAQFHDSIDSLPTEGPLLVVANEFFDALPTRQFVRAGSDWRERMVDAVPTPPGSPSPMRFMAVAGQTSMRGAMAAWPHDAQEGAVVESSTAGATIMLALARRIAAQGGAALIIDYGYEGPAVGDTLQAVRDHRFTDPFAEPGEADLTVHVDFTLMGNCGRQAGLIVDGPVGQGAFLEALGIDARTTSLTHEHPGRAAELTVARNRLAGPDEMGTLFKILCLRHPDWAAPEGFV